MQPDLALHRLEAIVATLMCVHSAAAGLLPDLDYAGWDFTMLQFKLDDVFIRHSYPLWWFNHAVTLSLRAGTVTALLYHHKGWLCLINMSTKSKL